MLTDIMFDLAEIQEWVLEIPALNGAGSWTDAMGGEENFLEAFLPSTGTGGFSVFSLAF